MFLVSAMPAGPTATMRALSVRQPWAELIALGKKKVEHRTWQTPHRGELLIVASAGRHPTLCEEAGLSPDALAHGAAVCVVDLANITGAPGDYRWHLRHPRRVDPAPVKGRLFLYDVPDASVRIAAPEMAARAALPERATSAARRLREEARNTALDERIRISLAREDAADRRAVLIVESDPILCADLQLALARLGRLSTVWACADVWPTLLTSPPRVVVFGDEPARVRDFAAPTRLRRIAPELPLVLVTRRSVPRDRATLFDAVVATPGDALLACQRLRLATGHRPRRA